MLKSRNLPVPDIVDRKAQEENRQVAVPKSGENVIELALVGLGFVLILFANYENVLAQKIGATSKTDECSENQKYVSHAPNI